VKILFDLRYIVNLTLSFLL